MKIRPVGAKLFHTDGRIDRHDEAHSRFSQFCEKGLTNQFFYMSDVTVRFYFP